MTVLEALPAFLGAADDAVAKEAQRVFAKQGLDIHLGIAITKVTLGKRDVTRRVERCCRRSRRRRRSTS